MPDPTKLEINRLYSRNKPIKRTVVKPTDEEDEVEETEETYVKDPITGQLIKVKSEDTIIKKSAASWKRTIGDTAAQMKKAEELGLKSASEELRKRMAEKLKAKKQ